MELSELLLEAKAPKARGQRKKKLMLVFERNLEDADIDKLADGSTQIAAIPPLRKLRERHHQLARCLASGVSAAEASLITGYQLSSIGILKMDPAFKELLSYYNGQKDLIFLDFQERLKQLGVTCFQEIMDRLEDDPTQFSLEDLREFLIVAADRTGNGPTKGVNFSGQVGVVTVDDLLRIKQEVSKRQNGTVEKLDETNYGPQMGTLIDQKPLAEEAQVLEPSEKRPGV